MDYEKLMKRARLVNRKRDAEDRKVAVFHAAMNRAGHPFTVEPGAPADLSLKGHLQVAIMAIQSGIRVGLAAEANGLPVGSWHSIAEGLAMLEEIERRMEP